MDTKEIIKSNKFKIAIYIIAGILVLLLVFQAGMLAGFQKASYSNRIGEMYFQKMNGSIDDGPMADFNRGNLPNAHGAIGQIISIDGQNIVVEDRDGTDKTIKISSSTIIKGFDGEKDIVDGFLA